MILQLFGTHFRQWQLSTVSGGKRDFVPPLPDDAAANKEVKFYLKAEWARGRISLLDFLRKSNAQGDIVNWITKAHEQKNDGSALESFARRYKVRGRKVVAAQVLSWLNDKRFGQWLLLNVPFNDPQEFIDEATLAKVPAAHRYLSALLTCEHSAAKSVWQNDDAIRLEMTIEGHTQIFVESVAVMIEGYRGLIDDYITGKLDAATEQQERQTKRMALLANSGMVNAAGVCVETLFASPIVNTHREFARINAGVAATVRRGDVLLLGGQRKLVQATRIFDSFRAMLTGMGFEKVLPGVPSIAAGVRLHNSFKDYASLAKEKGVIAFVLGGAPPLCQDQVDALEKFPWTAEQKRVVDKLDEYIDWSIQASNAADEEEADDAKEKLWNQSTIIILLGPPGSGKTTMQKRTLLRTANRGGKAFFGLPTNALMSRMSEIFGTVDDVRTCHSVFGFDLPEIEQPTILMYNVGFVDECQQLTDQLIRPNCKFV